MGFDSSVWVFYYPEDLIWCRCSVICKPSCSWQTSGDFLPCYDNILHFAKQLDCFDVVSKSRRTYLPICGPFFVGMCKRRMFTNTQSGSFFLFRWRSWHAPPSCLLSGQLNQKIWPAFLYISPSSWQPSFRRGTMTRDPSSLMMLLVLPVVSFLYFTPMPQMDVAAHACH